MSAPASELAPSPIDQSYTLEDKYTRAEGRIYLSGVQALVRLPLMQQMRDRAAGHNTGGFISGYRGSPLGGLDLELWKAKQHLKSSHIEFTPGLNEDLGATMVWGTQQTNLFPGATVDGVFSMWYGKGPGVDRCGDVFKHGNAAGTSRLGGVLALAADDHACRSSTLPHGSELEFVSAMMPVLNPAGVQDILDMGLSELPGSRMNSIRSSVRKIAIGSLLPDSISSVALTRSLRLSPRPCSNENTAAASVDDTMAPISRPTSTGRPSSQAEASPATSAVIITPTVASTNAGRNPTRNDSTRVRMPPSSRITASARLLTTKAVVTSLKTILPGPSSPASMPTPRNSRTTGMPIRCDKGLTRMPASTRAAQTSNTTRNAGSIVLQQASGGAAHIRQAADPEHVRGCGQGSVMAVHHVTPITRGYASGAVRPGPERHR
jgi:hypothetical protein